MGGDLVARLVAACNDVLGRLPDGTTRRKVEAVRSRLTEPLRVAVGGRVKAGKSTLVNALLGQRIAATDVGECTKVVAWYRYDVQDRIEVTSRDGVAQMVVPRFDGRLPDDLGMPFDEVDHLTVWMSARERLRDLTLIDTPGLYSVNAQYSDQTSRALGMRDDLDPGSRHAVGQADALIYLMPHPGEHDRDFLEAFQRLYPDGQISAANVVGVLSKIDMLGSGRGDPWPQARKVAANYERKMRSTVACIVPVAGLLAETGAGSAFTERDMRDLRALAELDGREREVVLESTDSFLTSPCVPLELDRRRDVLSYLGLHGLRVALDLVDQGHRGAGAMLDRLRRLSGIDELQKLVDETFAARADTLKADRALAALDDVCFAAPEPEEQRALRGLRSELERIRLVPAMHAVREIALLRTIDARAVVLPADLEAEAIRVAKSLTPASKVGLDVDAGMDAVGAVALERATAWRRYENHVDTSAKQARAAAVIRESYEQIYFAVDAFETPP
jgi:hypothetical protein